MLNFLREKLHLDVAAALDFEQVLFPPPAEEIFTGGIIHPSVYIWDAWMFAEGREWNLYTLASPRALYVDLGLDLAVFRDYLPHHWRRFVSDDAGKTWRDDGAVMMPRLETDYFDSRSIWTGSVLKHDGCYLAGYTGIRNTGDDNRPKLQALGLAVSDDKRDFRPLTEEPLSCPLRDYEAIRDMSYYLGPRDTLGNNDGEEGGPILAWRDPWLVKDRNGTVHMLWGAKSTFAGRQEPVVGHGVLENISGRPRLKLLSPIFLPDAENFTQIEVPQIRYNERHGLYVMMISTTNKTPDRPPQEYIFTLRFYVSERLNGGWRPVRVRDITAEKRYPGIFFGLREREDGKICAFYNIPFGDNCAENLRHSLPAGLEETALF
jgi:hypothetical protein